jgi:hypothetical protein
MQATSKLRYYDAAAQKAAGTKVAAHSEFLRTGRISRHKDDWLPEERRYLTYAEVAERTALKLQAAGEMTHQRLNGFHRSIQFPKLLFHRTLENSPHLGYCHVTAARTTFAKYAEVRWAFYIANFYSELGEEGALFQRIRPNYARMYFAVALSADDVGKTMMIDRTIRKNGLLFRTHDPKEALKNVLMLGARNEELRKIIRKL